MARLPAAAEIEASPEADRLEGYAHPRNTRVLYGQQTAEVTLSAALQSGRMHHAWLLAGPQGIGKATLAYRCAKALLAKPDERGMFASGLDIDPESRTARQVEALSHPGLIVIRRGYDTKAKRFAASISVDDVRRLRSFLNLSSEEGGRRVVIVDSADEMNVNSANALLKSLEEPPADTVFFIVSSEPGRLLPTIRSRCRRLTMEKLSPPDLRRAAAEACAAQGKPAPSDVDMDALEPLAEGSVRRILALAGTGGVALQSKIEKLFQSLPHLDHAAAHQLADELHPAAAEQKFDLFFELLFSHLARLTSAAASGKGTAGDIAAASRLIGRGRLAAFAEVWETLVRDHAQALALNLDKKSLVLDTLGRIETAARG